MNKVFGGLLMGCGILIAGLSGLCVLVVAGSFLSEFGSASGTAEFFGALPTLLMAGGIPFAIGVGLFFLGRQMVRRPKDPPLDLEKNNPFE